MAVAEGLLQPLVAVVDDSPPVARTIVRALGPAYAVRVFGSGAAVLEWLADGASPDVILCDLWMPVVTGEGVHRTLRCVRPELLDRIVYMSGALDIRAAQAFLSQVSNPSVGKPFLPVDVRAAVEGVLARVGPQER